jgi:hypothetical protein
MAQMNMTQACDANQVGGATLTEEVGRWLALPQYWGRRLIIDDALGSADGNVTQVTQAWNVQKTGERLYFHPSIWSTNGAGTSERTAIDAIMVGIQSTYPGDYHDSIPIAILYGSGSTQDNADAVAFVWPSSLRGDNVHPSVSIGRVFHADLVASAIISRGWDGNRAPQNKRLPIITKSSNTLSAFPGVWHAYPCPATYTTVYSGITCLYPVPTYTYQWYLNGSAVGGATSRTLDVSSAPSDSQYTVQVTATNSQGSASVTSDGFWVNRTPVSAYSSATNTLINSMVVRPGSPQAAAIDTAMATIQSLSSVLDWINIPLHTEQASRINWINGTTIANPALGASFIAGRGWTLSSAAVTAIRQFIIPDGTGRWTANNAHFGVYVDTAGTNKYFSAVGTFGSGATCYLAPDLYGHGYASASINSTGSLVPGGNSTGHFVVNLSGGTSFSLYENGSAIKTVAVSGPVLPAGEPVIGNAPHDGILGAFHFGGALNSTQVGQLQTVINNLRTAFI